MNIILHSEELSRSLSELMAFLPGVRNFDISGMEDGEFVSKMVKYILDVINHSENWWTSWVVSSTPRCGAYAREAGSPDCPLMPALSEILAADEHLIGWMLASVEIT